MPPLQYLEPNDGEDWDSSEDESSGPAQNTVNGSTSNSAEPTTKDNPSSATITFDSLPPSSSPSPAAVPKPSLNIASARADEWSDDTEGEDDWDPELVDAAIIIDSDDEEIPHIGSDLHEGLIDHGATSVGIDNAVSASNVATSTHEPK